MTENEKMVFVYANRLNPTRDAFREIEETYGGKDRVRREYIIDNFGVTSDDVAYLAVRTRMEAIVTNLKDTEKIRVILAGYSPLVAVLHDVARDMGLEESYFIRDVNERKFVEVRMEQAT